MNIIKGLLYLGTYSSSYPSLLVITYPMGTVCRPSDRSTFYSGVQLLVSCRGGMVQSPGEIFIDQHDSFGDKNHMLKAWNIEQTFPSNLEQDVIVHIPMCVSPCLSTQLIHTYVIHAAASM